MIKYIYIVFLLGINFMWVIAQDTIKSVELGNILIEGAQQKGMLHTSSVNDKIQNLNQVKNVADLFKEINGISLVKRSAYALDPVFRSFKYEQLNVQYDGGTKCMHACPNRMDPATSFVIPEEIEKIEIIRGPFSVRYGANFGGVFNLVTHKAPKTMGVHGNLLTGYETNGNALTSSASIAYANRKYDLKLNASMRDYGNYKDGSGVEVSSSFKSYDYALKTGYNMTDHQRLQISWRQSFGRDVNHAGLPMDTEYDNSSIISADYRISDLGSKIYSLHAKVYYSYVDHLMSNKARKNFKIVEATTPVEATTLGAKLELQLTPSSNHIIYLGADFSDLSRHGNRSRKVKRNAMKPEIIFDVPKLFVDSIWQDATINNIGIFGEGKYHSNKKLTMGYGVRLDLVNTKSAHPVAEFKRLYEDFDNRTDINLSGHLSASYRLSSKLNMQLAIGRGVRSASMEEKYINHLSIAKDPYEYVGNPLLKPEANHQLELNINGIQSGIHFGANIYYSYITDYIIAAVDSTIKRKYLAFKDPKIAKRFQNIDKATQAGMELFMEFPIVENLSLKGDLAYVKAYNYDWNEPLALISPMTGTISLKYELERFWMDLRSKFVSEQDQVSIRFGEEISPSYHVFDFRIGFKPYKGFTIAASVLNMSDEHYYDHLNFSFVNSTTSDGKIYEQGRNINLFLKYEF